MDWIKLFSTKRKGDKGKTNLNYKNDRNAYEQDYDRIVFSHAFRSLQDKTQVFPMATQTFVHTRLTHSLEVSSVARSLGKLAGDRLFELNLDFAKAGIFPSDMGMVTSTAALAHDIGNPPFGHAGESAISGFFSAHPIADIIKSYLEPDQYYDLCHFEGNAQGYRLLTEGETQGLRITNATLGAFTKYPCSSNLDKREVGRKSQKKYGFYTSSYSTFKDMAEDLGLVQLSGQAWARHPLSFLVEAADDICYAIIDLEDGTNLGLVDFETTKGLLSRIIGERYNEEKLKGKINLREKTGILRALAINQLILESVDMFIDNEKDILNGQFDKAITDCVPSSGILKEILGLSIKNIYKSRLVLEKEVAGFEILHGLLELFVPAIVHKLVLKKKSWRDETILKLLPEEMWHKIENGSLGVYGGILVVLDYIASLTDSNALRIFNNMKGASIPSY